MSFCDGIHINDCLTCYEGVLVECENIVTPTTDLVQGSTYWLHLYDKFDNVYSNEITIGIDGIITLEQSNYPNKLFNGYGVLYFYLSSEEEPGNANVPVIINDETYNCFIYE